MPNVDYSLGKHFLAFSFVKLVAFQKPASQK